MAELIGLYEIAQMAKVTTAAITNWRKRFADFPAPVAEMKAGPVFSEEQVVSWLRKRGKIMGAKVISMINLKGGVAKTTTSVGLAQLLASEESELFNKRVLVIDLDPQTNATVMLIGEERWRELNAAGRTLATLFQDAVNDTNHFSLQDTLQKGVSHITAIKKVDLLPSSIDLIDIQDKISTMSSGRFYAANPTEILKKAVKPILEQYDYVIIDCPPNMGLITLNGLRISHAYIIPTIPDVLSTYGIPQVISRIKEFSDNIIETIQPLGIVATKVRGQSALHERTIRTLREEKDAPFFRTIFYENNQMAEAAEYVEVSTLRQKWGYQGQFERFLQFAEEVVAYAEGV